MTSPTRTSYLAKVLGNAITMLSKSATWQTLLAVATEAEALSRIVENWGGTIIQVGQGSAKATDGTLFAVVPPYAIAAASEMPSDYGGVGAFDRSGTVTLEIVVPGLQADETPAELSCRAFNTIDQIREEIEGVAGQDGCLATFTADTVLQPLPDDTGANLDAVIGYIVINWRA